jgi:hypothetical protein
MTNGLPFPEMNDPPTKGLYCGFCIRNERDIPYLGGRYTQLLASLVVPQRESVQVENGNVEVDKTRTKQCACIEYSVHDLRSGIPCQQTQLAGRAEGTRRNLGERGPS